MRRGERVLRYQSWDGVDRARLTALIESSFGRRLVPDYFERTRLERAYISENYRTAVILTDEAEGTYLDKFAVLEEAQAQNYLLPGDTSLPQCSIRESCRWFDQTGADACAVCDAVVTETRDPMT